MNDATYNETMTQYTFPKVLRTRIQAYLSTPSTHVRNVLGI